MAKQDTNCIEEIGTGATDKTIKSLEWKATRVFYCISLKYPGNNLNLN